MAFFNFTVEAADSGRRLDQFLVQQLPQFSRSFVAQKCRLTVNGARARPAQKVQTGQAVQLAVPRLRDLSIQPEKLPLAILFEDHEILVLQKPAGQVVHPTDHGGHVTGTVVNALLAHLQMPAIADARGDALRPGLVHRLDRDTSGLLLIAKTPAARTQLATQFADRAVEKEYLAVVAGQLPTATGRIEAPLRRHPTDRTRRVIGPGPDAREAITEFEVVEKLPGATLVRVHILTGRTHQIRVHFASLGHPVLGDSLYGRPHENAKNAPPRLALHAARLAFTHPASGQRVEFAAPLPADLTDWLARLRG